MRKRTRELMAVIPVLSLIVVFLALFYLGEGLGFDSNLDTDFMQVIPGLAIFVIGIAILFISKGILSFPCLMFIGVGVAYTFGTLDTMGMITTQMKSGLTIDQIQLWIIVIFGFLGGILNAIVLYQRR